MVESEDLEDLRPVTSVPGQMLYRLRPPVRPRPGNHAWCIHTPGPYYMVLCGGDKTSPLWVMGVPRHCRFGILRPIRGRILLYLARALAYLALEAAAAEQIRRCSYQGGGPLPTSKVTARQSTIPECALDVVVCHPLRTSELIMFWSILN